MVQIRGVLNARKMNVLAPDQGQRWMKSKLYFFYLLYVVLWRVFRHEIPHCDVIMTYFVTKKRGRTRAKHPKEFSDLHFNVQNKRFIKLTSLNKQPTFGDAITGFPAKWRLTNERRNSILTTRHCPDLGSAFDWLNQIFHAARPIRSKIQIWNALSV